MKTHFAFATLLLCSLSALAADITGTWKAEFNTQRGLQKYTFTLKQDGTRVTGKANVERDGEKREAELKEGKVEGDTVTFVETLQIQDNEIKITYTGKVSGNEIKFTRKVADLACELDFVARNLPGVGDLDLVVLNLQRFDKRYGVAFDLAFLQLCFTFFAIALHVGFAGDARAVLFERKGVFLQTALGVELGFPCAGDVRCKSGK